MLSYDKIDAIQAAAKRQNEEFRAIERHFERDTDKQGVGMIAAIQAAAKRQNEEFRAIERHFERDTEQHGVGMIATIQAAAKKHREEFIAIKRHFEEGAGRQSFGMIATIQAAAKKHREESKAIKLHFEIGVGQKNGMQYDTFRYDDGISEYRSDYFTVLESRPCYKCKQMTLNALLSDVGYRHHRNKNVLIMAGNSGCRICLWIMEVLGRYSEVRDEKDGNLSPMATSTKNDYDYPPVLKYDQSACGLTISPIYANMSNITLSLFADEDDTAASIIPDIPKKVLTLEATVRKFNSLLMCAELRTLSRGELPTLPRRIIDVGLEGSEVVHLLDFGQAPPKAHYFCLSHRWSESKPLTTTLETLSSRLKGIALVTLSPTFRDAIILTRALGYAYIWIDSLCVLQDSAADWEVESSRMGLYYGSSWLTIGAGLGGELGNGLFGQRYTENDSALFFGMHILQNLSQTSNIYFTGYDERRWDNRGSSLLFSRGWTLQEEALAPCFLSFQPRQASLRIGSRVYHECGYHEEATSAGFLHAELLNPDSWMQVVEDYSARQLSRAEDKLPALSGLAHHYLSKQNDTYLAGIWRNALLKHLCWCVADSIPTAKSPGYRAPSWSWASLDGKVSFDRSDIALSADVFEILDASTETTGLDAMGQVCGGSITVRGQICAQLWKRNPRSGKWYYASRPLSESHHPYFREDVPYTGATLLWDHRGTDIDQVCLWSLPIKRDFALALQQISPVNGGGVISASELSAGGVQRTMILVQQIRLFLSFSPFLARTYSSEQSLSHFCRTMSGPLQQEQPQPAHFLGKPRKRMILA